MKIWWVLTCDRRGCELIGSISIGIEMEKALGEGAVGCLWPEGAGEAGVAADTRLTHEELPAGFRLCQMM